MLRTAKVLLAITVTPVLMVLVWYWSQTLVAPIWDTHNSWIGLFVTIPVGLWLGLFAGLAWATRDKPSWSGGAAVTGGIPGALYAIWLAWNSGSQETSFALRLLDPRWIGTPFLWSFALAAYGVDRLLREAREARETPARPDFQDGI